MHWAFSFSTLSSFLVSTPGSSMISSFWNSSKQLSLSFLLKKSTLSPNLLVCERWYRMSVRLAWSFVMKFSESTRRSSPSNPNAISFLKITPSCFPPRVSRKLYFSAPLLLCLRQSLLNSAAVSGRLWGSFSYKNDALVYRNVCNCDRAPPFLRWVKNNNNNNTCITNHNCVMYSLNSLTSANDWWFQL